MPAIASLNRVSPDGYGSKSVPVKPEDEFTVLMADRLLQSTGQYGTWKAIRQKDPVKAMRIARLVTERHGLFGGDGGVVNGGADRFDSLTKQLKTEGIHLFASGQLHKKAAGNSRHSPVKPQASDRPTTTTKRLRKEPYAHLDCFQFVAAVLEDNGIRYYGKGGVGNALINKAIKEHKPLNCFLTGEGVTRMLSNEAYTLKADENSFQETWKAIEPRLKEGAILSLSSRRFGHTGIVGVRNGRWVFIHSSGTLGQRLSYRVKEVDLAEEIQNWLAKAKQENASLDLTVGKVDRDMASAYNMPESSNHGRSDTVKIHLLA